MLRKTKPHNAKKEEVKKDFYIGTRVTEEELKRFDEMCDTLGISNSETLRVAVFAMIRQYKHHGNRLVFPLNWEETFVIKKLVPKNGRHKNGKNKKR